MRSREILELATERSRTGLADRVARLCTLTPTLALAAVGAAIVVGVALSYR